MQAELDAYADRKAPPLFSAKIRNAIRDRESQTWAASGELEREPE